MINKEQVIKDVATEHLKSMAEDVRMDVDYRNYDSHDLARHIIEFKRDSMVDFMKRRTDWKSIPFVLEPEEVDSMSTKIIKHGQAVGGAQAVWNSIEEDRLVNAFLNLVEDVETVVATVIPDNHDRFEIEQDYDDIRNDNARAFA